MPPGGAPRWRSSRRRHTTSAGGLVTRRGGKSSCTSTRRSWRTTRPPVRPISKAVRPSTRHRFAGCSARQRSVTMLERGREVLGVGRRRRLATRAQRRALLRRDGGCARPGCTETRIERLHAHHMRWWMFGGRTDVAGMVLLCDVDHGLVHDLDLVMTRREREADRAHPGRSSGLGSRRRRVRRGCRGLRIDRGAAPRDPFVGVTPIDEERGRRPAVRDVGCDIGRCDGSGRSPPWRRPIP